MRRWKTATLAGLLATMFAGCGTSNEPQLGDAGMSPQPLPQLAAKRPATDPELNAILDQLMKVYADAKSYRDAGTVTRTEMKRGTQDVIAETSRSFRTLYSRPDRFRLEIKAPGEGGEETVVEEYWTESGPSKLNKREGGSSETTEMTMLDGLSLTDPVAKVVPRLLIKEIAPGHRKTVDRMEMPGLAKETVDVDGHPCHDFHGAYDGSDTHVYIDTETHVIRKVELKSPTQGSQIVTTVLYHPELDVEIPAEDFTPKAPAAAQ